MHTRLIGVLLSDAATSKEEAAGLAVHLHVVLQVVQSLRDRQWLMYDWEYRVWAVAKGVRAWGDLNLPIYGRCLQRPAMFAAAVTLNPSTTSVLQME